MNRYRTSCREKGRLFIHVESNIAKQVKVFLTDKNNYCDVYTIYMDKGKGNFRADGISFGVLQVKTDIDSVGIIYYPDRQILFEENNYVHKLNIIDRRKKDEV